MFGDVRDVHPSLFDGVDAVVNLAAISNDPMGNLFEEATLAINHRAAVQLAVGARKAGVRSYVFASSCSVYGCAQDEARRESSPLGPLTTYARSKMMAEAEIIPLAGAYFTVSCLRFATACGMSPRLRLDLVLNDFVAGALASRRIDVLSDGTPWRPLINVDDMARAIVWAVSRPPTNGGQGLVVNVGSAAGNYQVETLARTVARAIPDVTVSINRGAPPDKRSYQINYDLFQALAPACQPRSNLEKSIAQLETGLRAASFRDTEYRSSQYVRRQVLTKLRDAGLLTESLTWRTPRVPEADR
jgi:nucleoside-diphosphate-sugar epimerase